MYNGLISQKLRKIPVKPQHAAHMVFLIFCLFCLRVTSDWVYRAGIEDLRSQGNSRLELYTNYLNGVLEKYESLPELLAIDEHLVRALLNPHDPKRIETLNKYLETINRVSDTLDTYLMNRDGLTIAASNWNEKHPFIGRNFSYRPYFKQAMKGKLGRYFALGTTSAKRGYYFAYPVKKEGEILGAVTIKINIDTVEKKWAHHDDNFLVSDPDGVIFITTNPKWRYKTMRPLEKEALQRIVESKRYHEASLLPLSTEIIQGENNVEFLTIPETTDKKITVVKQSHYMPQGGWNVHILSDRQQVLNRVVMVTAMVGGSLVIAYFLLLLLLQRRVRNSEMQRIEEQNRKALQDANEQLETRVMDRTRQLTESNELLRKEVLDRKATEIKLKRTRKELIHAAKLAVLGQMSAGINHELNQPLAAIRSYADNGKLFLQRKRFEEALWNLEQIGELTERMAQIGIQLKLFSKKSSGEIKNVPIHGVVDGALEILMPSIKKNDVTLTVSIHPDKLEAVGNHVLFQQVLVNLLSNGVQAMETCEDKRIVLECKKVEGKVLIVVHDNGPGIPPEQAGVIFEPFYTSKKSGQGLGLGLTITERIIKDFGGSIRLAPSDHGARFEVQLISTGKTQDENIAKGHLH